MLRMLLDKIMKRVNVPMPMLLKKGKLNLLKELMHLKGNWLFCRSCMNRNAQISSVKAETGHPFSFRSWLI
uniref:Uncharacterized protein n=1 Tax=Picea sitchensis TaxID=3332 RepID=A0A6B9XX41_PICSI|nr:hypothetical protein Q903MT_gene6666 [Picea sitchensis]